MNIFQKKPLHIALSAIFMTYTFTSYAVDTEEQVQNKEQKIIVWAHNSHVKDAMATSRGSQSFEKNNAWNLGQMVRSMFGKDKVKMIEVTLEEIYSEKSKIVSIQRYNKCNECEGQGGKNKIVCDISLLLIAIIDFNKVLAVNR